MVVTQVHANRQTLGEDVGGTLGLEGGMGKIVRRGVQNGWVWWSVRIFTRLLVGHMCQHMGKPVPTPVGEWGRRGEDKNAVNICLVGYNICNGRNGGLESALHAMVQANMDLRVLFKTNITGGV